MPLGLGLPEILIVLVIVLVVFGPKRLPDLGRSLGSGMREFKDSITGGNSKDDDEPSKITAARADESDDAVSSRPRSSDDAVSSPPRG